MPTIAINFSRSASQIIGQYYNFIRLGREGYRRIQQKTQDVAHYLADMLEKTGRFCIYNDGSDLPVVCYALKENEKQEWTLYDLSDRLLMRGWQIPTYPLPAHLENIVIQRIVCRADLNYDMAGLLMNDLLEGIQELDHATVLVHGKKTKPKVYGFTH